MTVNPSDPLLKNSPNRAREIFEEFAGILQRNGASTDDAICACQNVILNALRMKHGTLKAAQDHFDASNAKTRDVLSLNYTPDGSKRRSVFPFDQNVVVPLTDLRGKINGVG